MLLSRFDALIDFGWSGVFSQERSFQRAKEHVVGMLCSNGKKTISQAIYATGRGQQDWSADYKMYARSEWEVKRLYKPVLIEYLRRYRSGMITLAIDDTKLHKTGKHIATASYHRDPLSPAFHVNFMYGLRFLQASLLFPHYKEGKYGSRGIPVRFTEAPPIKKPGKRGTEKEWAIYRAAQKVENLSMCALKMMQDIQKEIEEISETRRKILFSVDGSFCNQTIFKADIEGIEIIARARKDACLCYRAVPGTGRKYDKHIFKPEEILKDKTIEWQKIKIHYAGKWRKIKIKEINNVLWRRGAGTKDLRLFVIAAQPYQRSLRSKRNYRQPAYLLCTDTKTKARELIQGYFDRWQIEVNHKEEKSILGVGEAQVRSKKSVPRQPAFAVATYSMLLLAGLLEHGPGRTEAYLPLPKWRKVTSRPSLSDLIALLRKEINETLVLKNSNKKIAENRAFYSYT